MAEIETASSPLDESIITAAEQEAAEAENLAQALAERVRDGEDIDPAELANAEQLGRFARLRVEAAHRKVAKAREAERQRQLAELAAAMRAHDADPDQFDQMLTDIETALTAFAQACADRNTDVRRFREQMMHLGVPSAEQIGGVLAPKEHARLGWTQHGDRRVIVGNRSLNPIDPGPIIAAAVHRIAHQFRLEVSGQGLVNLLPNLMGLHGPHDLHEHLRRNA